VHSSNHCCHKKSIIIAYSEHVSVAIYIQILDRENVDSAYQATSFQSYSDILKFCTTHIVIAMIDIQSVCI